jgi:hypothetical protein
LPAGETSRARPSLRVMERTSVREEISMRKTVVAFAVVLAGVAATAAGRADAADGPGFSALGTLVARSELSGQPISVGGNIALKELNGMVRLDVLSLAIPNGGGSMLGALASGALSATSLFPPGGFTVVFDRAQHTYTVWSPSKHTYFTSAPSAGPPSANPAVAATAAIGETNDFLHAFTALKALRNMRVFAVSLALTGHGTTNGHPTTGLSYDLKRQEQTGDLLDIAGGLKLADDLDEIPVQLIANVKGAPGGAPPSAIQLDLTSVDRHAPSQDAFIVPAGFTKASQISDVFGRGLPI